MATCPHPDLQVYGDPRWGEWGVTCLRCHGDWLYEAQAGEDPGIPADVLRRAVPVWQSRGLGLQDCPPHWGQYLR